VLQLDHPEIWSPGSELNFAQYHHWDLQKNVGREKNSPLTETVKLRLQSLLFSLMLGNPNKETRGKA